MADLPTNFEEFAEARKGAFMKVKGFKENGGNLVGVLCSYTPCELIEAAGAVAIGLCGTSNETVPDAEEVLPKNLCPLIKGTYGFAYTEKCPFTYYADFIVGETTCDGKKKAYEIMAEEAPVYVMDMPQMKREKDIAKWADEIADFKEVVEKTTGNTITAEKLGEAIKIINNKRKALARVYETRKGDVIPISGKDALLMMQIAFFDDPVRCAEMCNKLADELEQRVADGVSVFPAGTKRIMLSGTPMAIPNWKMHHIIETCGGAVVCEEACTGTRYFEGLVDESATTLDEQIEAIARRYMGINCACFTPNTGRIDDVVRLAKEYKVDGIIDVNLKFCCLYDTEKKSLGDACKEAGIAYLPIETDYDDSDAGQLRTRVEAFIEMLG